MTKKIFKPGNLVIERRQGQTIAHYIILQEHYIEGCNVNGLMGYQALVTYSANEKEWYRFNPGSQWFIKHSDLSLSEFEVLVENLDAPTT